MAATEHRSNQVNSNTNQFQTILNRTIFSFFCNCPIVKQIFYSVLFHSFFPLTFVVCLQFLQQVAREKEIKYQAKCRNLFEY